MGVSKVGIRSMNVGKFTYIPILKMSGCEGGGKKWQKAARDG